MLTSFIIKLISKVSLLHVKYCNPIKWHDYVLCYFLNRSIYLLRLKSWPKFDTSIGVPVLITVWAVSPQMIKATKLTLPVSSAKPVVIPSHRASPPFGHYQIILLGDGGV